MTRKKIPYTDDPEIVLESKYIDSAFVKVESTDKIFVDMKYPALGMKHAEQECFLRKEVYDRLLLAQQNLPDGYCIKIWDGWRSFLLQKELFDMYYYRIIENFNLENKPEEEKIKIIQKYINFPQKSPYEYPVHASGGAVDVTLTDSFGKEVFMGTDFDEMIPQAQTDYYERSDNEEVKNNRRILYNAMKKANFTNLPSEWWHYDYGDRYWAHYKNKPIMFEPVYEKESVKIEKAN